MDKKIGKFFLNELNERILIADGAIGTMLYAKGVYINRCFDELNLSNPAVVSSVHAEYVKAGANIIETNTFGANRLKLKSFGYEDKLADIIREGVNLAKKEAQNFAYVAGSIGPIGLKVEPYGKITLNECYEYFFETAENLIQNNVDLIVLETFPGLAQLKEAIKAVRDIDKDIPIIAEVTLNDEGNTIYGETPENVARILNDLPVDIIGANCSVGPALLLESLAKFKTYTKKFISAMPNAGMPRVVDGRFIYLSSPEYFAEYTKRFIEIGINIIGGCCGTTPEHIKRMVSQVRALRPQRTVTSFNFEETEKTKDKILTPIPLENRSNLAKKIVNKKFVISVEIDPPRGTDVKKVLDNASCLKKTTLMR